MKDFLLQATFSKKIFSFLLAFNLLFALFAAVQVVNPIEGTFNNRQSLVINVTEGEEVFYSFSNADPLTSGFIYDGPTMLDIAGDVELCVVAVDSNQNKTEKIIKYSVLEDAEIENPLNSDFINQNLNLPIIEYIAGDSFAIPSTLSYKLGEDAEVFERGQVLSTSRLSLFNRFIPFTLTDGKNLWRFVLRTNPSVVGELSLSNVPFKVTDWNKITFTDSKIIYSLDGEWWQAGRNTVEIDRTHEHILRWQSVDYDPTNEVGVFVLPPKPSLRSEYMSDGTVRITIDNASVDENYLKNFRLSGKTDISSSALYKEIILDTFKGDAIEGNVSLQVYSAGVYQGDIVTNFELSKRVLLPPEIVTSASSFYSRDKVEISVPYKKDVELYARLSEPVEVKEGFNPIDISDINFTLKDFSRYNGKKIELDGDTNNVLAYHFEVYAIDKWKNESAISSYTVVIDKYNYYVDSSLETNGDGSPFLPFNDLSHFAEIVNSKNFSRFMIKGLVSLPLGETNILQNVELIGTKDARVVIPPKGVITVRNASFNAKNIIFEKPAPSYQDEKFFLENEERAASNLFIFEHGSAQIKDCQIFSIFANDGMLFNVTSSAINILSSKLNVQAEGYGSCISALNSKTLFNDSTLSCFSSTAVNFSIKGGSFELKGSNSSLSSRMGRIGEFIDCSVLIKNNSFTGSLTAKNASSYEPLWFDNDVLVLENADNKIYGFEK